ncbi:hypothetical protein AB0958_41765 [Streptomyces sp. NPDC006655]
MHPPATGVLCGTSEARGRHVSHDTGLTKERNTFEPLINEFKAWRW